MQFRIYPSPKENICTPFLFFKDNCSFSRLYSDGEEFKKIIVSYDFDSSQIKVRGISKNKIFGERKPNHEKIIKFIDEYNTADDNFKFFVQNNYVLPTFPLSKEEAFIKTIIRQIISSKWAKKLFSDFVKKFGIENNGIFGFPTKQQLNKITLFELNEMGLSLKAEKIKNGIKYLNKQKGILKIDGIGSWSREILTVELKKDYSYYPFWDKSGSKILKECGINLSNISQTNKELAGNLYIYGVAYLETLK